MQNTLNIEIRTEDAGIAGTTITGSYPISDQQVAELTKAMNFLLMGTPGKLSFVPDAVEPKAVVPLLQVSKLVGSRLADRAQAMQFRTRWLEPNIARGAVLDFSGVDKMSSTFANEAFGDLVKFVADKDWMDAPRIIWDKFKMVNLSLVKQEIIKQELCSCCWPRG